MIRLLLRLPIALLVAVTGVLGAACTTYSGESDPNDFSHLEREFVDQTPDYVPDGALDSVVLIHDDETLTIGSGTVIAPDRVLTAAHVVDGMSRDDRGRLLINIDGEPLTAVIEALGDPDLPHGDWAILAFDRPHWRRVAPVHQSMRRPNWVPEVGTEVLLVGYAAGFFPGKTVNVDAPTPSVRVRIVETDPDKPAWYAVGKPLHLGGMSGGGAMIWNHESQRAELIGVFRGYVGTETVTTSKTRILGMTTSVHESTENGVAYIIHRLPTMVTDPRSANR